MEAHVPTSPHRRDEFDSVLFVLRWQRTVLANLLRSAAARGMGEAVRTAAGACFLIAYYLNLLHEICQGYSPHVKHSGYGAILAGLVLAAVIGILAAVPLTGFALRLADARWLAALPVSAGQRLRAAGVFGGTLGGLSAVPVAATGWLATGWLGLSSPGAGAALVTAAYLGGFGLVLMLRVLLRRTAPSGKSRARPVPPFPLSWLAAGRKGRIFPLARFDQARPRWLGHWVLAWATDPALMPRLVLVVLANAAGIAASIVQGTDVPALVFTVLTAHLVYLSTLRMHPLASPVLRAAPLDFLAAFIGAARLPLVVSFAAVAPLAVTAIAVAPGDTDRTLGCLLIHLLLAVQYASLAAMMPAARGAAILLHAVILVIAAKESILYQYIIPLALCGFTVLAWFRAKRRYER